MRVALGIALAAVACGDAPVPAASGERFARRVVPFAPGWIPESEIPTEPPQSAGMVIWELSLYAPGTPPTPEQRRAADALVESCFESARRHGWFDYAKGLADGFAPMPRDPRHYRNEAFLVDDHVLDPDRPEFLMYYPAPDGDMALTGFMFYGRTLTERGPQIGGPLTVWHYHAWRRKVCFVRDVISLRFVDVDEPCPEGVASHRSAEMMHVWLVDRPGGPFATAMTMDPQRVGDALRRRRLVRGF